MTAKHTRARFIRYAVAAAVVVALLVMAMWPSAQLVDSATVDRGPVRETIEAEGRTRVRDRYLIAAPIAATARRLTLEPGDRVKAGQTLVVLEAAASSALDPRTRQQGQAALAAARTRLAAAREQARAAEATASQAAREARRLRALAVDQLVAAESAERAATAEQRASREAASARFLQATAEHEVAAAEAVLAHDASSPSGAVLELDAPVDGVVIRRHYESQQPVQVGDPLLEIGDPSALEVEVDVLSADAVRLQPGMAVELLRTGAPGPLAGRVRVIEPGGFTKISALGVEEQRAWVIVDLTSPRQHWARLGDAYRVNARFLLNVVDDALRIPMSALFAHGEGHAVFRIDGDRARLTVVEVGLRGGALAEIRRGLEAGDEVVVHPDRQLAHGDRVRKGSKGSGSSSR